MFSTNISKLLCFTNKEKKIIKVVFWSPFHNHLKYNNNFYNKIVKKYLTKDV